MLSITKTDQQLIKELSEARGIGTTLVTILVPANQNLWLIKDHIKKEIATCINIKSKQTMLPVIHCLKSIDTFLSSSKLSSTNNGLIICAGDPTNSNLQSYI